MQCLPGWDHVDAARAFGAWADRHGIAIDFVMRRMAAGNFTVDVIMVLLTRR